MKLTARQNAFIGLLAGLLLGVALWLATGQLMLLGLGAIIGLSLMAVGPLVSRNGARSPAAKASPQD